MDSIITYYRLKDAGIDFHLFEQSSLMAAMLHASVKVKNANDIKTWLDQFEKQEKKQDAFEHYLLNKLAYPYNNVEDEKSTGKTKESLNRLLERVLDFNKAENIDSQECITSQKDKIEHSMIIKTFNFIVNLAEKFSINLEEDEQNNNNVKNEGEKNDENS